MIRAMKGMFHATLTAFAVVAVLRVAGLGVSWWWGLTPVALGAFALLVFGSSYLAVAAYFAQNELKIKTADSDNGEKA